MRLWHALQQYYQQRICPFVNCVSWPAVPESSWTAVSKGRTSCPDCHSSTLQMQQLKELVFLNLTGDSTQSTTSHKTWQAISQSSNKHALVAASQAHPCLPRSISWAQTPLQCITILAWYAGGRFHIHATSDGLKKDAETFPDLLVTLKLQGLHAPLAERFVELPVDITAGVPLCLNVNSYAVIVPAQQSCTCGIAASHDCICPYAVTPLSRPPPPPPTDAALYTDILSHMPNA